MSEAPRQLDRLVVSIRAIPDAELEQVKPSAVMRLLWLGICGLCLLVWLSARDSRNGAVRPQ